ncbi:MAG TPA: hypothetical protein H9745_06685 [Candidatus Agathobaculum stercoravium]|nr:hypothetical protein [Candidatus Agathobaculum stercoravium]
MKLELSNAERNALLDAAGRDKVAPIASTLLEQAKTAGLTHLQAIAVVDYIRRLLESPPSFGGFEKTAKD